MARILYADPVDEIAGSIGGTTFQANQYGFTIKRKPVPTRPNLPRQNSRKSALFIVTQNWIALSSANKTNWNTYATSFPRPTRLNPDADLNGFNFFCAYHLLRIQQQSNVLSNPSGGQTTLSINPTVITQVGSVLTWVSDVTVSGGNWRAQLYISRPLSPSLPLKRKNIRWIRGNGSFGDFSLAIQGA